VRTVRALGDPMICWYHRRPMNWPPTVKTAHIPKLRRNTEIKRGHARNDFKLGHRRIAHSSFRKDRSGGRQLRRSTIE
jgi:hypothetical protein